MATFSERLEFLLSLNADAAIREARRFGAVADKELGKADDRIDRLGARMTRFGAGAVAASGVAAVALFKTGQAAGELEQAVGGTEAVFGEFAGTIDRFASSAASSMGLSERAFREATTRMGGSLKGLGFETRVAADQAVRLTGVAADLAATYGGTTVDAVDALAAAFRGEADPAERFNLFLNQTRVNAKAVSMGLAESEANVSQYAKAQATLALIMEQSADAQGQFARESDTLIGKQQIARAELENSVAAIGQGVLPVMAELTGVLGGVAEKFNGLSDSTQEGIGRVGAFAVAGVGLAGTLSFVAGKVIDARARFQQLFTTLDGDGNRSMNRMGAALGVAGVAGAIFTAATALDSFVNNTKSATEIVDELSRKVGDEQVRAFEDDYKLLLGIGKATEAYTEVARENLGTAIQLRNAYAEQGRVIPELNAAIDAETKAQKNANAAAEAGSEAVDGNTESTEQNTESKQRQTRATRDAADAARDQARALRDAFAAQDLNESLDDAFVEFADSLDQTAESSGRAGRAIDLVAEKEKAVASATEDAERALDSYRSSVEKVEDANRGLLDAQKKLEEALAGPSAVDRREATQKQTDADLDLEDAKDRVADAQEKLNDAEAEGDPEKVRKARNDLAQAKRAEEEATERLTEATEANTAAEQWSADQAPEVAAARDAVAEAEKRHRDALDEAAKKYGEMNEAARVADETVNASLQSFADSDGALYNNRLNVDATKESYLKLRDAIREKTLAILEGGLAEAQTVDQLDALKARVNAQPGLTDEQRGALIGAIDSARASAMGFTPGFAGYASGTPTLPMGDAIVGENGPERIRRTATGWEVVDAGRTRSMLRGAASRQYGDINVNLYGSAISAQDVGREVAWATRTN